MKTLIAFLAFVIALVVAAKVSLHVGPGNGPLIGAIAGLAMFAAVSVVMSRQRGAVFANNFGVLNDTVVVFDAFSLFLEQLLPLRSMILDVQDEVTGAVEAKPGSTITVKDWRTTVTAYQPGGGGYAPPVDIAINAKDRQLTLPNTPWAVSFALTAAEFRLLSKGITKGAEYTEFRNKLSNQMVNGLGKKTLDLLFAVVTVANYLKATNETVSADGTFNRSAEIDLDTKLFGRNVPSVGAQVICSPTMYGEWVKDHVAIQTNTGENRQVEPLAMGGHKSQNSNFTFWRINRPLPADADRGIALSKTGIIGAFRVPDEATFENDPVSLNTLIDPVTGIPMLARLWKNAATGTIQMDLATMPVFGKGQTEGVERIMEEATA